MPRKRAPAKTGRPPAIPYDLRKSHIPRIPHPGDAGSGEDPTGDYIPAAAKKQIETMQERQASFGLPAPKKSSSSLQRLREEINNKKSQKQKTTSNTVISTPANKSFAWIDIIIIKSYTAGF
jgi:hypothetical protein